MIMRWFYVEDCIFKHTIDNFSGDRPPSKTPCPTALEVDMLVCGLASLMDLLREFTGISVHFYGRVDAALVVARLITSQAVSSRTFVSRTATYLSSEVRLHCARAPTRPSGNSSAHARLVASPAFNFAATVAAAAAATARRESRPSQTGCD